MKFEKTQRIAYNDDELKAAIAAARNKEEFIDFLRWSYQLLNKGWTVQAIWNAWNQEVS